jgi:hypothetical protein
MLQDHLISRLIGQEYNGDEHQYSREQRASVVFMKNRLYRHKVLRINYTTYDMRRDQDSINPRTHPDIMMLSQEDDIEGQSRHPYWYARVVGVFHTVVKYTGVGSRTSEWQTVQFLWIRWFGQDPSYVGGFKAHRLHRIGFVDNNAPGAFGFLDPQVIIRAVHLIPAYSHGRTNDLLAGPSIVRCSGQDNDDDECSDYVLYYINM